MLLVIQILYTLSAKNNIYEIMLYVKPHNECYSGKFVSLKLLVKLCQNNKYFLYFVRVEMFLHIYLTDNFSTMETAGQATVKFKE